jgi:hypothetical protein
MGRPEATLTARGGPLRMIAGQAGDPSSGAPAIQSPENFPDPRACLFR